MSKIMPCIWLDDQAEEAAEFYVSVFPNSEIKTTARYPEAGQEITGKAPGSVMTVSLVIDGQDFLLLNGGPQFKPSEAISFVVYRDTQAELDDTWNKLIADGGEEGPCGWCKDRFGVSWQVTPSNMDELLSNPDPAKANKAMNAMLKMKKIDIAVLQVAVEGR